MKAIVIGGSNGIGLTIVDSLLENNHQVLILDRVKPNYDLLKHKDGCSYICLDLRDFDPEIIKELAENDSYDSLFITAGIGRIADFETFDLTEIEKTFTINTVSIIKILRIFYERLCDKKDFYCSVMCSISGRLSSPVAALYSASKASLVKLIEGINVELEEKGTTNRVLEVSPGTIPGTRFYGKHNDLDVNKELANTIIDKTLNKETVYIPDYDSVYHDVIDRYSKDPRKFGLESYEYKHNSNRVNDKCSTVIGYMAGTFDLFHQGHLNILKKAKNECDYLIVGVHESGSWKGKETIVPFEERKEIVQACQYVDKAVKSCTEDSDAWSIYHYHKLFVGDDYKNTERFIRYEEYFKDKDVEIVYFPYTKSVSSTMRRNKIHILEEKK